MRYLLPIWLSALVLGTSVIAAASPALSQDPDKASIEESDSVAKGYAFAKDHCSSCHAIEAGGLSPNPLSPRFESIVNRKGLTRETLIPWLNNSHFFPDVMDFEIEPGQVENLAAYMVTLQHPDFRPIPQ